MEMVSKLTRSLVKEELRPWLRLLKKHQSNNNQQMTLTFNQMPKFSKEPQARESTHTMSTFPLMKTISLSLPLTPWILAGKQMFASFRSTMLTTEVIVMLLSSWPKLPHKMKKLNKKNSFLVTERPSTALSRKPKNTRRNTIQPTKSQIVNCQRTSTGEMSEDTISPTSIEIKDTADHAIPSLLLKLPNQDLRSNMVKTSHSYHHNTS